MTFEIIATLTILLAAVVLFISERLRMDLVAMLVLVALALVALVTPSEALSGFSNPAVITVWAVFILSGGLARTGVAAIIGRQVLRLAGQGEARLLVTIMLTAGILSAFMNNVGVAAMLLPVVVSLARQTRRSPSRLLMPLASGCLLGGLTTLIGTPPNILASDALRDFGLEPFRLLDFTPVGLVIMLAGTAFMVLVGRRLLPERYTLQSLSDEPAAPADASELYGLYERLALITIPRNGRLAGKTLSESRIGRALGLTVLGLERADRKQMYVGPQTVLQAEDGLLALGRLDRLELIINSPNLVVEDKQTARQWLYSHEFCVAEHVPEPGSPFIGKTVSQLDVRQQYGVNVLAVRRNGRVQRTFVQDLILAEGDTLLFEGQRSQIEHLRSEPRFEKLKCHHLLSDDVPAEYELQRRLYVLRIPENSRLVGRSLLESRLGNTFDIVILGILRADEREIVPEPETLLLAGDTILVEGNPEDLEIMHGLQELEIKRHLDWEQIELESASAGLVEAVLSPRTTLTNKTLRQVHFREKYGVSVLAIWRGGRVYRTDLGNMKLQLGDAFLLYGLRDRINLLGEERDFVILHEAAQAQPSVHKAPVAALIMAGVAFTVLIGWLPISVAAVTGAALMVLTGCLTMEEAYESIDWRSVFLIAGMLPLGIALDQTGTAHLLSGALIDLVGRLGPTILIAGLFLLTNIASQFMPNAVVAVLMAPIAINAAVDLALSERALMMVVAIAASAAFMSPVGHPANALVMGPGGYRFSDYLKVGVPMTLLVLVVTLLILPIFWPLTG